MKKNLLWMALGSLITICLISVFNFFTSYHENVDKMKIIEVGYKGEWLDTGLSADICDYITEGKKWKLYFGELPSQENAIEINAPHRATIYIYPSDEDSVLICYEPRGGIKRTFVKSGYGDFNRILEAFYELTENEVFNETIE